MRNIATSLSGEALSWFQKSGLEIAPLDHFVTAFKRHFIPPGFEARLNYKLDSMCQQEGQRLRDFVSELRYGHALLGSNMSDAALMRVIKLRMLNVYRTMPGAVGMCGSVDELLAYADKVEEDAAANLEATKFRASLVKNDSKPSADQSLSQIKKSRGILNVAGVGKSEGDMETKQQEKWVQDDVKNETAAAACRQAPLTVNPMAPPFVTPTDRMNYWGGGWQVPITPYPQTYPMQWMPPNAGYYPVSNMTQNSGLAYGPARSLGQRQCYRCHQWGHVVRDCTVSKNE
jgi:hypothetical protein